MTSVFTNARNKRKVNTMTTTAEFAASKEFVEAFKQAASIALKKARHRPILECVKVSVIDRAVTVEATDLQTYYRRTVELDDIHAPVPLTSAIHRIAVKAIKPGTRVEITDRDYTIGAVKTRGPE